MHHLINVRLPDPLIASPKNNFWSIQINDDQKIESIIPMSRNTGISGKDWKGDFLSPRGVDLQINGGLGLSFTKIDFKDINRLFELLDRLWKDGVEAISPTFVTCHLDQLRLGLSVLREARKHHVENRCELLGAHLEGPFLSREFIGAHDINYLISPSLYELEERIKGFEDEIALVTLAPELPGSHKLIKRLRNLGIVVALGHSACDGKIAELAFQNGVKMLTHAFNAMHGIHHRLPGPITKALLNKNIFLGLIADGVHIHPDVAVLMQKLASRQLVLVSDAISPYGLEDGRYVWDNRLVISKNGSCTLEDGTLAGSNLPLLEGAQKLAYWSGERGAAIWSATIAPREVLETVNNPIHEYFLGRPLSKLLRWETNKVNNQLFWQTAA